MGTDNTQFRRRFRVWRRKVIERGSTFSLRSMELEWLSHVGPRLKVGVLVEGNVWTLKSRIFVEDSSGKFGGLGFRASGSSEGFVFAPRGREPFYSGLFSI